MVALRNTEPRSCKPPSVLDMRAAEVSGVPVSQSFAGRSPDRLCPLHGILRVIYRDGHGYCRACQTERVRAWRARNPRLKLSRLPLTPLQRARATERQRALRKERAS